ncbi:N-acetyltransferase [Providencia sp.]|uniref:N-acetyltransferase n=1 Tax=Providencia sp. TaxID=589 RepID=UPI0025A7D675|nr:N-acetyltransferase [Providencia rettgeri]
MLIQYRLMDLADSPKVAHLLQANAPSNHGELLGEFPLPKVEAIFKGSSGTIIAYTPQDVIGVVFSFNPLSSTLPPIALFILERFPDLIKENWLYGPVCIDNAYRGKDILKNLYAKICALNTGKPVAFINTQNQRSLAAHQKLGMHIATNFIFDNTEYYLVIGN